MPPSRAVRTILRVLRRLRIENLVLIREADLAFSPGLNAITGETGAGKTILAQAIGLLLGSKGDARAVGPGAGEAYVEAEFDVPDGFFDDDASAALAELRPQDEPGLIVARRVFEDGRTRAYAWGRATSREDLAAACERLLGMSGQFEQRRLARSAYQLDVLDAFAGEEQARLRLEMAAAWRELGVAARRHEDLTRTGAAREARLAELRALVEDTDGLEPAAEDALVAERERLRHGAELAEAAAASAEALAPDDGEGAAELVARAEGALARGSAHAPELDRLREELADVDVRLRDVASELRTFLASLDAEPGRLEHVEAQLDGIARAKRRHGAGTYGELLERAEAARAELAAAEGGSDAASAAGAALAEAEARVAGLAAELREARRAAARPFARAVAAELASIGLGEGEFRVDLGERTAGPTGADEATFLIRANRGLAFAPVADTASGGELSRIALAIAAAAGGRMTLVFDEIDAGIGGTTAHAVGEALQRLADRAQVVTITHLPQIATLADRHFRVEKVAGDPTVTRIEQLTGEARRDELQRMLGGQEFLASVA